MLVTPKPAPYCVAPLRSSSTPVMGSVCAPTVFTEAGISNATGPTGAVGVPPLAGKLMVVVATGLAGVPLTGAPLAVTNTFQVSVADFWK